MRLRVPARARVCVISCIWIVPDLEDFPDASRATDNPLYLSSHALCMPTATIVRMIFRMYRMQNVTYITCMCHFVICEMSRESE